MVTGRQLTLALSLFYFFFDFEGVPRTNASEPGAVLKYFLAARALFLLLGLWPRIPHIARECECSSSILLEKRKPVSDALPAAIRVP